MDNNNKQKKVFKNEIKYSVTLNEEQKEAKRLIHENQIVIITGRAGCGKCQPLTSVVFTPEGISMIGDIKVGDYVISEEGKPIKVINVFPQQEKKKIYKITFSDGSTAECTDDHLWNVCSRYNMHNNFLRTGSENKKYQEYETLTLEHILKQGIKIGKTNKDKWFIPITKPINFNNRELKIDPYILGCLLGDGCIINTPNITTTDVQILQSFEQYCTDNKLKINLIKNKNKQKEITYSITGDNNVLTQYLKQYGLYGTTSFNKFIPKQYLYNSVENRIALLQGLMDTDGWVQINKFRTKKGHTSQPWYCTVSKQLKDDFVLLIQSLGGVCYVSEKQGKYKAKGEKEYKHTAVNYRICINLPNDIRNQLFKLTRKQERITPQLNIPNRTISNIEYLREDDSVCILVDSPTHLYLTDNCIVTHNSLVSAQTALDFLFKKEVDAIYVTRAAVEVGHSLGFLPGNLDEKFNPYLEAFQENLIKCYDKAKTVQLISDKKVITLPVQFIRGKTIDDILIVEEAQNLTKSEILAILTRLGKNGRIVINGDNEQKDIKDEFNGLSYVIELSKKIEEIKWVKLKENHRSDLVGKILDCEYGR